MRSDLLANRILNRYQSRSLMLRAVGASQPSDGSARAAKRLAWSAAGNLLLTSIRQADHELVPC